jgi:hypothetical protein
MMMTHQNVRSIETRYRGYRFRSRTEARWAVFMDAIGVEWQYEAEGFNVNGIYFLPDFWLPQLKTFVEIKPDEKSAEAAEPVLRDLVNAQNCHGIIITGAPNADGPSWPQERIVDARADGLIHRWAECIFCHHVWLENVDSACDCPAGVELLTHFESMGSVPSRLRIDHALGEAQRARFEHSEGGTPTPFVAPAIVKPTIVYLAGAVSEKRYYEGSHPREEYLEWRREIFPTEKKRNWQLDMQPRGERVGPIIYGGPLIDSINHGQAEGCIHGRMEEGHGKRDSEIAERCLKQLLNCDVMFVWIDRIETVGTMIEIGAAFGRIPIFVAFADRELADKAYFAAQLADVAVVAPSAIVAWKLFTQWWAGRQDSSRAQGSTQRRQLNV